MRLGLRLGWAAWIALAVPAVAPAQGIGPGDGSAPESAAAPQRTRGGTYIHDLVGPGALVGVGLGAGYAQWRTDPPEWGTGAGGYGKRAASTAGALFAQETVRHGLAAVLGRSTEYERCACRDFGGRVGQAIAETFTDRDRREMRHFSVPRVAGALAGGFAPMIWTPHMTTRRSLGTAAGGLALTVGGNLLSEFLHWPN